VSHIIAGRYIGIEQKPPEGFGEWPIHKQFQWWFDQIVNPKDEGFRQRFIAAEILQLERECIDSQSSIERAARAKKIQQLKAISWYLLGVKAKISSWRQNHPRIKYVQEMLTRVNDWIQKGEFGKALGVLLGLVDGLGMRR